MAAGLPSEEFLVTLLIYRLLFVTVAVTMAIGQAILFFLAGASIFRRRLQSVLAWKSGEFPV